VFWFFIAVSVLTLLSMHEFNRLIPATGATGADSTGDAPSGSSGSVCQAGSVCQTGPVRLTGWAAVILGLLVTLAVYMGGLELAAPIVAATPFSIFALGMLTGGGTDNANSPPGAAFRDAATFAAFRTLGVVYLALPFSYLVLVKGLERGEWWIMFLLLLIWANDTFAYFTGRAIGRTKLSPRISPKKTIEGAVGGLIGGAIAALLFNNIFGLGMGVFPAVVLSVVIGVVAIFGDLIESVLKRAAGVKDSGRVIPGHGGILDRIDSLVFAVPVLYYFMLCQANI
jgi:phosphatidate cytidylyltransferase